RYPGPGAATHAARSLPHNAGLVDRERTLEANGPSLEERGGKAPDSARCRAAWIYHRRDAEHSGQCCGDEDTRRADRAARAALADVAEVSTRVCSAEVGAGNRCGTGYGDPAGDRGYHALCNCRGL